METSTVSKTYTESNIADAITALQEQVKVNSDAIKQGLTRDKPEVSTNIILSIVGLMFAFMLTFSFFYFNKLDNDIKGVRQELSHRIDRLESKIDANHKQILDILVKR